MKQLLHEKARETYDLKEAEYPGPGRLLCTSPRATRAGQKRYDRDQLVDWARERFGVEFSLDDLKNKQQEEIRDLLIVDHSRSSLAKAAKPGRKSIRLVEDVFAKASFES